MARIYTRYSHARQGYIPDTAMHGNIHRYIPDTAMHGYIPDTAMHGKDIYQIQPCTARIYTRYSHARQYT